MSRATFPIPPAPLALAGLVTLASTGCAPAIVGEWRLTELNVNSSDFELEVTFDYGGQQVDQTLEGELRVTADLTASFESRLTRTTTLDVVDSEGEDDVVSYAYTYAYAWEGEGEAAQVDEIDLELAALDESREDLELDCTLEDDELECDGDNGDDDVEMVFVERRQSD